MEAGPSEVGVRGARGGGPGCGSGKEKEEKQGRERGRGRQPASRLYIPAVLIHHVTAWSVDSQREREGEKGGEVWGEGSRDPLVLGTSRAVEVYLSHPPKKRYAMSPHILLALALFLSRSPSVSVGEFKRPAFGHFFLFPRLFIPTGRMAASHGSLLPTVVRLGR